MPVHIKSRREIGGIRNAGRVVVKALDAVSREVGPGVALRHLERLCADVIRAHGGEPTFLGYRGYPAAVCVSVNDEVVHGIPGNRVLAEGDIVKVDVGVTKDGLIADAARTFEVGRVRPEVHALVEATERAFWKGVEQARHGNRVGDISHAVQEFVERHGYSVVRALCGHAVGLELHEEPSVPNYGRAGKGMTLKAGMTLAVEPMVNLGGFDVDTLDDGWTVVTKDGSPSAHYEHTVLVTDGKPEILTGG
ncbi:MAG: type I methionyl aminopeptidase [candidate division WOR-3 bacterium]|nr:MAG: type I methionyl aminopeptidase [candidate division WOR-3 bacterium]